MASGAFEMIQEKALDTAFFGSVGLFRDVPSRNLLELLNVVRPVRFAAGEIIITQGDETNDFLIVREGTVEVFVLRDADEVAITRLGPTSYFGEMAVFDNYPRSASVRAITDVTALSIGRDDFRNFLHANPAALFQMCTVFTHRLRNTNSALSKH